MILHCITWPPEDKKISSPRSSSQFNLMAHFAHLLLKRKAEFRYKKILASGKEFVYISAFLIQLRLQFI